MLPRPPLKSATGTYVLLLCISTLYYMLVVLSVVLAVCVYYIIVSESLNTY